MQIKEGDGPIINSVRKEMDELSIVDSESVETVKMHNLQGRSTQPPPNRQPMQDRSSQNEMPSHLPPQTPPSPSPQLPEPPMAQRTHAISDLSRDPQQEKQPQNNQHQQLHPNESLSSSKHPQETLSGHGSTPHSERDQDQLRHKQKRLILLHHSAKCQHKAGKCLVTPHCTMMKQLWEHITQCKECSCTFPHCRSSRYILSHYRKCKDSNCQGCNPVREIIRNSRSPRKW
jgi:TAZ zinc finger